MLGIFRVLFGPSVPLEPELQGLWPYPPSLALWLSWAQPMGPQQEMGRGPLYSSLTGHSFGQVALSTQLTPLGPGNSSFPVTVLRQVCIFSDIPSMK